MLWMWCVQGCRAVLGTGNGGLELLQLHRGAWFPCWGYPNPHSSTTPCKSGGPGYKHSPAVKGEGFSTCLSVFLNPGQVLCFTEHILTHLPHGMLGEDPSRLWQWLCSEQQEHLPGTVPSRNTDPRKQHLSAQTECLLLHSWAEMHRNLETLHLRKKGNCSLIGHVEVTLCADSRGIWAVPRGVVMAPWVTSQL